VVPCNVFSVDMSVLFIAIFYGIVVCICFDSHDFIGSCQTTLKQLTSGEIREFEASYTHIYIPFNGLFFRDYPGEPVPER